MVPAAFEHAGNAPQHAQGFDGSGRGHTAEVFDFPTELLEQDSGRGFARGVVAADEHAGFFGSKIGVDHMGIPDGVKGLDEMDFGICVLQPLHQGVVELGEEAQNPVLRRRGFDGIGRVDNEFARHILGSALAEGFERGTSLYCQYQGIGVLSGRSKIGGFNAGQLMAERRSLLGVAAANRYAVSVLQQSFGEALGHHSRADDSVVHGVHFERQNSTLCVLFLSRSLSEL